MVLRRIVLEVFVGRVELLVAVDLDKAVPGGDRLVYRGDDAVFDAGHQGRDLEDRTGFAAAHDRYVLVLSEHARTAV